MITARSSISRIVGSIQKSPGVRSVLVGGSVQKGTDDEVSDLDLWVVSDDWSPTSLDGLFIAGSIVPIGGSPLFHGIDSGGVIVDIRYGPQPPTEYEPLQQMEGEPLSPVSIEPQSGYTDYWISSYKHRKPLWRGLDAMAVLGLHFDRVSLLRAWVESDTGTAPGSEIFSIHGLTPVVRDHMTPERRDMLSLPTRSRRELMTTIQSYRTEMKRFSPADSLLPDLVINDPIFCRMLDEAG